MAIRVFLLDDHELVRRGVRDLLWAEEDMTVVGEASTADEALDRIPQTKPDVAVLDVRLGEAAGDQGGIMVCREIRSAHPEVACVMLTSFADDEALFASIMAGAAGYVLKQIRGGELVSGIRRVAAGESLLDPTITTRVLERLRNPGPVHDEALASLTPQERRDPRPHRGGHDQSADRRGHVPRREDGEELRVQSAHEAGHGAADRGRRVRRAPRRAPA